MATKFNIGDKVKIIGVFGSYTRSDLINKIGTIIAKLKYHAIYVVKFDEIDKNLIEYNLNYRGLADVEHYIKNTSEKNVYFFLNRDLELIEKEDDDSQFEEDFEESIKIKFNDFLNEKMGFPDLIRPYANLIYDECEKRLNKYLDRKGFFSNYKDIVKLNWDDIKEIIDENKFKSYPIERMKIYFTIKAEKRNNLSCDCSFYPIYNRKHREYSHYMKSKSGLLKRTIHLNIDIGLIIGTQMKSFEIHELKQILKDSIIHELTHSYESYYNSDFYDDPINNAFMYAVNIKYFKVSETLYNFFWNIYKTNKGEVNATISEFSGVESLDEIKERDAYDVIKSLRKFDTDKTIEKVKKELNMSEEEFEVFFLIFGDFMYEIFDRTAKRYKTNINKTIEKMRGKSMEEVFDMWKKIFIYTSDYILRKAAKMIGNV